MRKIRGNNKLGLITDLRSVKLKYGYQDTKALITELAKILGHK